MIFFVNAWLMLILEVCSMWKLCQKSGSHTQRLHHQLLRRTLYVSITINHNQFNCWTPEAGCWINLPFNNQSQKLVVVELSQSIPRIHWVSQLPVSVFRLLYKPYQPATRLGVLCCYNDWSPQEIHGFLVTIKFCMEYQVLSHVCGQMYATIEAM